MLAPGSQQTSADGQGEDQRKETEQKTDGQGQTGQTRAIFLQQANG